MIFKVIKSLLIVGLLGVVGVPKGVYAHNIPTVMHSITLEYTERNINFSLNYNYDPIIVHRFLPTIDKDNNREISVEEKEAIGKQYLEQVKVIISDQEQQLRTTSIDLPQYSEMLIANNGLTIKGTIDRAMRCNETAKVKVTDSNVFLSVQDDIYSFTHINKDCLSVSQINTVANTSSVVVSSSAQSGSVLGSSNDNSWLNFTKQMSVTNIQSMIQDPNQGLMIFMISIALAVIVGGLHALTPGHGKTLVAAYLVGQHGTVKDALVLGMVTTLTHTLSIYVLGFLSLFATKYFLPEKIIPALELLSAVSIFGIGVWLIANRYKEFKNKRKRVEAQISDHDEHPHDHQHDHNHQHTAGLHSHGGVEHTHDLSDLKGRKVTLASLISLGFSGGIVPCTDALAIMILAISLQQIVFGMILILFFSIGLAGVLIAIGIILVTSKTFFDRFDRHNSFSRYAPLISAFMITALGVFLILRTL